MLLLLVCLQPIVVEKGLGAWVWDTKGDKYLDMTTGQSVGTAAATEPSSTPGLLHTSKAQTILLDLETARPAAAAAAAFGNMRLCCTRLTMLTLCRTQGSTTCS
jgi:acetylornithine/succinyldiaminopimelate/putrescine aminotransferase